MNIPWQMNDAMKNKVSNLFRHTAGSLTVLLGLVFAMSAAATDLNPRLVGSFKTSSASQATLGIDVSGNVAYVSTYGDGLQILDISNPTAPTKLGGYYPPGSTWRVVYSVVVSNNYAYACDDMVGLFILDVSNPAVPRRVGGYKPTASGNKVAVAYDVFLAGKYAYIAAGEGGLVVLDVSNPASPRRVGQLGVPGEVHGVTVSGNYAYLADRSLDGSWPPWPGTGALRIMDISNPASPQPVADYPVEGEAWSLAVSGNFAYVAAGAGLQVIDVSDPANPQRIGSHSGYGFPVISGNRAVTSDLQVLDISNPATPRRIGGYPGGGGASSRSVAVVDHYAVRGGGQGLQIIDLDPPANLPRVGNMDTSGNAYGVAVSGTRAYIADGDAGLQVIDISDPVKPASLGGYATTYPARFVAMSGNYACVLESYNGGGSYVSSLEIVDTTSPASPQRVGSYDFPGYVTGNALATSGDYAFLTVYEYPLARVEVVDLRTPASPQQVGVYNAGDSYPPPTSLAVYGAYLLMASDSAGLRVLEVSDPANPHLVGSYTNTEIKSVAISGTKAYAMSSTGFLVLDLSIPTLPKVLGSLAVSSLSGRLAVSGDYVYAAAGGYGVQVIDVSNPTQPRYAVGNSAVSAYDLTISGNHVFVAGGDEGLQVFDLALSNTQTPTTLGITRSGSTLVITWPAAVSGAVLETTSQLAPAPAWSPASETPVLSGGQNVVTIEHGAGSRFFRLKQP